jgi:hypothetical protein
MSPENPAQSTLEHLGQPFSQETGGEYKFIQLLSMPETRSWGLLVSQRFSKWGPLRLKVVLLLLLLLFWWY